MAKKYVSDVEDLIRRCSEIGYEFYQIEKGCLGYGHFIMVSPDSKHWNIEVWEEFVNEWSSAHRYRRFHKISKRQLNQMSKIENPEEDL